MKFSNDTEFRFATPKYSKVSNRLCYIGVILMFGFRYIFPKAPDWISGIGTLTLLAALVITLIGTIAERKEWEAKQKTDAK